MAKRPRDVAPGRSGSSRLVPAAPVDASAALGRVRRQQNVLVLNREGAVDADTKDYCGTFSSLSMDNSWDLVQFKQGFRIEITALSDELVTFDMVGIDPPLANAFRRILIAEVATVAISRVTIYQNTGVIHDENLAHRLGLVPIVMEPEDLQWREPDADFDEDNSVVFALRVACEQDGRAVYSRDLVWEPLSDAQRKRFEGNPPHPVVGDILIAKLRSGQEIECICHCEKGIGRSHAKWSPVCTANYRLLPVIKLTKDIVGDDAEALKRTCPMGVFDIEDVPGIGRRARVAAPRKCTTCRECLESFDGEGKGIVLAKAKDHYLFSIESVGQVPATKLFERALTKLKHKCKTAKTVLEQPCIGRA